MLLAMFTPWAVLLLAHDGEYEAMALEKKGQDFESQKWIKSDSNTFKRFLTLLMELKSWCLFLQNLQNICIWICNN